MAFFGLFGGKNTADATIKVGYNGRQAESGLKSLKGVIKTVITAAVIKQVADFTYEIAKMGAEATSVQKNFASFAEKNGQSAEAMTARLRKATLGMVNDMDLQQQAMKAMISGVDFEDLIVAMEYVTKYAAATGADVGQKMTSVMTGFARQSAMFMDDVGIQVMGAADVNAAAIEQMKQKMGDFNIATDDVIVKQKSLQAEWDNMKVQLGQDLEPAFEGFIKMLSVAAEKVGGLIRGFKQTASLVGAFMGGGWSAVMERSLELTIEELGARGDIVALKKLEKKYEDDLLVAYLVKEDALKKLKELAGDTTKEAEKEKKEQRERLGLANQAILTEQTRLKLIKEARAASSTKPTKPTKPTGGAGEFKSQNISYGDAMFPQPADKGLLEQRLETYDAVLEANAEKRVEMMREMQSIILGEEEAFHEQRIQELDNLVNMQIITEQEKNVFLEEENKRHNQILMQQDEETLNARIQNAESFVDNVSSLNSSLMSIYDSVTESKIKNLDREKLGEEAYQKEVERIQEEAEEERKTFARIQQGIAVAEATVNAYKMAVGAGADTTGGAITRGLAVAAALATGIAQVAAIEAQSFQSGTDFAAGGFARVGEEGPETLFLPRGTGVATATETSMMGGYGGAEVTNNFYGLSTEQVIEVERNQERRRETGNLI